MNASGKLHGPLILTVQGFGQHEPLKWLRLHHDSFRNLALSKGEAGSWTPIFLSTGEQCYVILSSEFVEIGCDFRAKLPYPDRLNERSRITSPTIPSSGRRGSKNGEQALLGLGGMKNVKHAMKNRCETAAKKESPAPQRGWASQFLRTAVRNRSSTSCRAAAFLPQESHHAVAAKAAHTYSQNRSRITSISRSPAFTRTGCSGHAKPSRAPFEGDCRHGADRSPDRFSRGRSPHQNGGRHWETGLSVSLYWPAAGLSILKTPLQERHSESYEINSAEIKPFLNNSLRKPK